MTIKPVLKREAGGIDMPAIRINSNNEKEKEKTFWEIMDSGSVSYMPYGIYLITDRQYRELKALNLPIEIVSEEEVKKIEEKAKKEIDISYLEK